MDSPNVKHDSCEIRFTLHTLGAGSVVRRARGGDGGVPVVGVVAVARRENAVQGGAQPVGFRRPRIDVVGEIFTARPVAVFDAVHFDPVARARLVDVARLEEPDFLSKIRTVAGTPLRTASALLASTMRSNGHSVTGTSDENQKSIPDSSAKRQGSMAT